MAWYRAGGGGIPSSLKTDMNDVLNKKFGTSVDYPPTDWAPTVNLMGPLPEKTASGAIVTFPDGADTVPIKSWEVSLPASLDGYSEVDVIHARKNLAVFDDGTYTTSGVTFTCNNQVVTVSNTSTAQYPQAIIARNLLFKKGTYTASITVENEPSGGHLYIILQKGGSNYVSTRNGSSTFTLTEDSQFNFLAVAEGNGITWNDATLKFQIEVGSTATTYEPYTAPAVSTVNLGRTIYGGTADVVNGTGEATFGVFTFDGSDDENWSYSSGRFKITVQGTFEVINTNHYRIRQCSNNITGDNVSAGSYEMADNSVTWFTTNNIFIRKDDVTSLENWKQYLQNNPLKIGGNLAAPTDFTFTPITPTPETALGVNNFWADEGDTSVTYRADINLALGGQ